MGSKVPMKLNTVEELVQMAGELRYADWRVRLETSSDMRWVDSEAGALWQAEDNRLWNAIYELDRGTPEQAAAETVRAEWSERNPKPERVQYTEYYLYHRSDSWSGTRIDLSEELGTAIAEVWTKKPSYRGSDRLVPTGTMTLKGIVKRLGISVDGIAERIKVEQNRQERIKGINRRNYSREKIRKAAMQLRDAISDADSGVMPTAVEMQLKGAVTGLGDDLLGTLTMLCDPTFVTDEQPLPEVV